MDLKALNDWMQSFSRQERIPLTRQQAADLIDEFADMKWSYSDEFDLAFGDKFDDPLLQAVAQEFLAIQADYERNAGRNKGAISEQNFSSLKELSARLRSTGDFEPTSDSTNSNK